MRLLIEVEIPEDIVAEDVMKEIDSSVDSLGMGATKLRLNDNGVIVNSRLGIYGNWKVVRP